MQQENVSNQEVIRRISFAKFLGSYEANLYWTMNTRVFTNPTKCC